jgi:hypothetical protein
MEINLYVDLIIIIIFFLAAWEIIKSVSESIEITVNPDLYLGKRQLAYTPRFWFYMSEFNTQSKCCYNSCLRAEFSEDKLEFSVTYRD